MSKIVFYQGFTYPERDLMQKLLSEYVLVGSLQDEEFRALNSLRQKFNLPEIMYDDISICEEKI